MKVRPLADRVVVRVLEDGDEKKIGSLYVPVTAQEKPQQGEVLAVGPGRTEDAARVRPEVQVGDMVLFGKYSGTEVEVDGETVLIMRESDILAVLGEQDGPF